MLVLQELFMTARTLPVASSTTTVTATNGAIFIAASLARYSDTPCADYRSTNEPEMNGPFTRPARSGASGLFASGTYANACRPVVL